MQSLLDVQKAYYAPKKGPPMLLYREPNPLRPRKRKRRKVLKTNCPIPHRPKDLTPSNFPASQLPDGFPPELAFRALAAYSLLRTLSRELRLSPFTPNVFLRALYLPFPNKLLGQVHASLLRILLASLNMGFSCRPKGGNIPDVIRKKRRVDGIRWPLRAGDNLTFLDNFSWPMFYWDYCHLTADILWATSNDEENHADFRNIGTPDLTGMMLEEDIWEQEQEESLMAKPAKLGTNERNPYAMDTLSRSSRSARRSKVSYANASDDESYEDEPIEDNHNVEEDEEYMDGSKAKQGRPRKRSLPKTPTHKATFLTGMPISNASLHSRSVGHNGSNQQKHSKNTPALPHSKLKGKTHGTPKVKKSIRMLPSSRSKKSPPLKQEDKKRAPSSSRQLPTHHRSDSQPTKKAKRSPFSGSKVEWVEEGPSLIGGLDTTVSLRSTTTPTAFSNLAPSQKPENAETPASTFSGGAQAIKKLTVGTAPVVSASSFAGQISSQQNVGMNQRVQQFNAALAPAHIMQQMQAVASQFYSPRVSVQSSESKTTNWNQPIATRNPNLRLASCVKPKSENGVLDAEVSSVLRDFIGGKLFQQEKGVDIVTNANAETTEAEPARVSTSLKPAATLKTPLPVSGNQISKATSAKTEIGVERVGNAPCAELARAAPSPTAPPQNSPTKVLLTKKCCGEGEEGRREDIKSNNAPDGVQANGLQAVPEPHNDEYKSTSNPGAAMSLEAATSTVPTSSTIDGAQMPDECETVSSGLAKTLGRQTQPKNEPKFGEVTDLHYATPTEDEAPERMTTIGLCVGQLKAEAASGNTFCPQPVAATKSPEDILKISNPQQSMAPRSLSEQQSSPSEVMSTNNHISRIGNRGPQLSSSHSTERVVEKTSKVVDDVDMVQSNACNDAQQRETTDDDSVSSQSFESVPFADDEDQWPQFKPIGSMRAGIPYHRLPLEEKLAILEFLIDELLSMGTFASVFTERNITSLYGSKYGALPSTAELDELENEDECAVCRGEGELLCCDGCTSSYHRPCIDMKQNEVLPEGRWLCPECELVDPAKYGSLRGGRKSSLDWFDLDDIRTAIRLKSGSEQNSLATSRTPERVNFIEATTNPDVFHVLGNKLMSHSLLSNDVGNPSIFGLGGLGVAGGGSGQHGNNGNNYAATVALTSSLHTHNTGPRLNSVVAPSGVLPAHHSAATASGENTKTGGDLITFEPRQEVSGAPDREFLVIHGFVFARSRVGVHKQSQSTFESLPSLMPLTTNRLCEILISIGSDSCLAWPFAQIPFTTLKESEGPLCRDIVHPKVLAFTTKATYDPTAYTSKYRKTPLAKSAFPGAGFQSIQLLLSDYEYACNTCNLKRLSDRLSPEMGTDSLLARSLRAEANLFDPYQLIRDYMLKLENLLNRAHFLNEFWGTRNKHIKAHVWPANVRACRSISRLAQLLLNLVDACHRRAFADQWFVISGSKDAEPAFDEVQEKDSRTFHPLPSDWSLAGEKRKRKWERSSLANVLSLLAQEGLDVEQWVYGEGKSLPRDGVHNRRKRKQVVTGRSPYSPSRILVSSKDSKKFVAYEELNMTKGALAKRDVAALVDKEKKRPLETEQHSVVSVQVLQQAIDRRVTTGIPNEREKQDTASHVAAETTVVEGASGSAKSRRSRRSGRLQTKKESPEDFIANVIAESGKSQKELSMDTLIEAQKMSKLVEIKEMSAIAFANTTNWPVAGRLLFDPVGSLSPSEMKRLGRNAGTVMAPNVNYAGSYEVGQVSDFHIWRKNMQKCVSYEQILLLIRALESNLDRSAITSCEALARRTPHARAQVSKAVRCTQKDALTGVDHHFVLQKSKNRGLWVPSITIELSPFMVERSERREKRQEAFNKKLREKTMAEARRREAARVHAAAEAAARNQALMREQAAARAKLAKEQAEAKAKVLMEKAEAKAAAKAARLAAKAKEKAEKAAAKAKLRAEREAAREAAKRSIRPGKSPPTFYQANSVSQSNPSSVLLAHKMATQRLIRKSSNAGLSFVPEADIKKLRMKAAAELQKCYGGIQISSSILFSQLGKAESDALKAETEAKKVAIDTRMKNMAGRNHHQRGHPSQNEWPQPKQKFAGASQQPAQPHFPAQNAPGSMVPIQPSLQNQAAAGQRVAVGNHNSSHDRATNQASNFALTQMHMSKPSAPNGMAPHYPVKPHPSNPSPCFQPPNFQQGTPQQSSSLGPSAGYPASMPSHKAHTHQRSPDSLSWKPNGQMRPTNFLQSRGGEAIKQQRPSSQETSSSLMTMTGSTNAWSITRASHESPSNVFGENNMTNRTRLANEGVSVQRLLEQASANGGISSYQQAPPNRPLPSQHQGRGQRSSSGLAPPNNCLAGAMNNYPGGQFQNNAAPQVIRSPVSGYNDRRIFGGPSGYSQEIPGNSGGRGNPAHPGFDFEPTPIAEMATQTPPNRTHSPNEYQQQHPPHHHWFQR